MYNPPFTDEKRKENQHLLYTILGPLTIYTFVLILLILLTKHRRKSIKKEPLSSENGSSSKSAPNKHTFSDENVVNIVYHSSYTLFLYLTLAFCALASSDFTSA